MCLQPLADVSLEDIIDKMLLLGLSAHEAPVTEYFLLNDIETVPAKDIGKQLVKAGVPGACYDVCVCFSVAQLTLCLMTVFGRGCHAGPLALKVKNAFTGSETSSHAVHCFLPFNTCLIDAMHGSVCVQSTGSLLGIPAPRMVAVCCISLINVALMDVLNYGLCVTV